MAEKSTLIHLKDTVLNEDTTVKLTYGFYPSSEAYFEIEQIEGKWESPELFDKAWAEKENSKTALINYTHLSPEGAKKLAEAILERLSLG
jgi:hypothetical protein